MRLSLSVILSILIVSLLPQVSLSKCEEGCLACSGTSDECLICNVHDFYIANENKGCTRIPIENCAIPSADPNQMACDVCGPAHSLDNATRKCVEVPSTKLDENCQHYHWDDSCIECKDKFYLDLQTRRCKSITTEVTSCVTYEDAKTCRSCQDGFYYNLGSNTCQAITQIKDCLVYSSVECQACAAGYFQVSNLAGAADLDVDLLQSLIASNNKEAAETVAFYDSKPINKCVKGGLSHCKVHDSFETCKECESGYFKDGEMKCQTNPFRVVAQCQAYNQKGECIACSLGHYLDDGRCLNISAVSGCLKYDPSNHFCLECNNATHFKSGQSCGVRVNSAKVAHCKQLDLTSDHCSECIDSFQLTDSKLFCLPHIPHCQSYIGSSDVTNSLHTSNTTQFLLCQTCGTNFYLDGPTKSCLPQEKPGCLSFTPNSNNCLSCADGFYKNGFQCNPRTVSNCRTFNGNTDKCTNCYEHFYYKDELCHPYTKTSCQTFSGNEDHCVTCSLGFYFNANDCKPYTAGNCKTFSTTLDSCLTCFYGFYLDGTLGTSCYPITLKNCIEHTANQNQCTKCVPGHFLASGKCEKYTVGGCDTYVTAENKCNACESGYYKDSVTFECLEYSVANCNGYSLTSDACTNCPSGYFKDSRNDCQPKVIENCQTYDTSSNKGHCSTCNDGFKLEGGYCYKMKLVGCQTYSGTNCTLCVSGFFKESNVCKPHTVKFCATFKTDEDKCLKCIPGYNMPSNICIPWALSHCSKYNNDINNQNCIDCEWGYFLNTSTTPNSCVAQSVNGCVKYTSNSNNCIECRAGLKLAGGSSCVPSTQNTACLHIKDNDAALCKTCARSYYLDTTTFTCKPVPTVTNCREYFENSQLCKYCVAGMKPTNDNRACEPAINAPFCQVQKYNSDDCSFCSPGFYLQTDGSCVIQEIEQCLEYVENKNRCLKCQKGYVLEADQCSRFNEMPPNCVRLNANLKGCRICGEGFYPSEERGCLPQINEGCRLFAPNSNKCVDCQDNMVSHNGECFKTMSEPGCYAVNTYTEKCEMCKPKFYNPTGAGLCTIRNVYDAAKTKKVWDNDCKANFDSDNKKCTWCEQYNQSYTFTVHTIDSTTGDFEGCETATNAYSCTQCKNNFEQRDGGSTSKCSAVATPASALCLQMKSAATASMPIDQSGQCGTCRNYQTHTNLTGTCTPGSIFNCHTMGTSATVCETCNDKNIHTKAASGTIVSYECGWETNNTTLASTWGDADCILLNPDRTCNTCVGDKKTADCSGTNATDYLINFDVTLKIIPKDDLATPATNGLNYAQGKAGGVVGDLFIPQCNKTHSITILDFTPAELAKRTNYRPNIGTVTTDADKNDVEFRSSYIKINSCLDVFTSGKTLMRMKEDNTEEVMPVFSAAEFNVTGGSEKQSCMYWSKDGTDSFFRCLGCARGYVPQGAIGVKFADDAAGANPTDVTATGSALPAVMSCHNLTQSSEISDSGSNYLKKNFQGLGFGQTYLDLTHLPMSVFINFDDCVKPASTDLDAALVVFGKFDVTAKMILTYPFMINSLYQNSIWCLKMDNTQFFESDLSLDTASAYNKNKILTGVEHCQIHFYNLPDATQNYIPGTIITSANSAKMKCLSCRPGYSPTVSTWFLSACTIIANCDQTAATNTWMNACSKCKAGFGWKYDKTGLKTKFGECIDVNTSGHFNCRIFDNTNDNCIMCNDGYTLNFEDKCVNNDRDELCSTPGFPRHTLDNGISASSPVNFDYLVYLASKMSDLTKIVPYCLTCGNGFRLFKLSIGNTEDVCVTGAHMRTAYTSATILANCNTHVEGDNQKCSECNGSYFVVSDNGTNIVGDSCVQTGSMTIIANCKVIQTSSNENCLACKGSNKLYTPGYTHTASKRKCFVSSTTTNCDKWNSTNNYCEVCNSGFIIDTANEHICTAATASDGNCVMEGYEGQCLKCHNANYFPVHYKTTDANKRVQYAYNCVDQKSPKMQSYEGVIFGYNLVTDALFHIKNATAPSGLVYIDSLDDSHADFPKYVEEMRINMCVLQNPANTSNCMKWEQKDYQCSECNHRYYLKTVTSKHNVCVAYDIANCRLQYGVANADTPTCQICEYGWQLSANKQTCDKVHVDNCLYYDYLHNECFVCKEGYYLNLTGASPTCSQYKEIENCHLRSPISNKCENCILGYVLDGKLGLCVRNTIPYCQISSSTLIGFCDICQVGYELNRGKCLRYDTENNCDTENEKGECTSCFPGYQLVDNVCLEDFFKTIPGCVLYDQVGVLCVECDEGMIFAGGYCLRAASENCDVLWEGVNACRKCKTNYYLKDTKCWRREVTECQDYADDMDKCTSCRPGLLLTSGRCLEYTAENCKLYHPDQNVCLSCTEGHFQNISTQNCVQYSVINCKSFDPFRDMCSLCLPDFYRTNKGLCLARTTDKCSKTDPYQDVCLECDSDFYLSDEDYTGSGTDLKNDCKPYTALNCDDYNPRADKCLTCPQGFFMNPTSQNCYPGAYFNCKEWNADRTGCNSCHEGNYIDNKICYAYTVKACESYQTDKDECASCESGQMINNGKCVRRTAPNCREFHPTADLCESCPDGFFLSNFKCVRHKKKHCSEFAAGSDYCLTCESNFFFNNGVCLPYAVTCLSYDPNSNACTACPPDQYLETRSRVCVSYTVQNCASLNSTANKCVSCDDDYYWENGLCKAYTVNHCEIYHTLFDECVTCRNGFYPLGRKCKEYSVKHCTKKSPVADICLVCMSSYFNYKGHCHPYTAQHCATFNPMRDACLTCKEGAFFKQAVDKDFFVCEPAKSVDKCKVYNADEDACAECEEGNYFEPIKNACMPNPSAVSQCSMYSSATACKECLAPYYLNVNKNECVKSTLTIDKCIIYASNSRCSKCEGANLLRADGDMCERIIEFSCLTYRDNRNCASCEGNKVIQYVKDTDNSKVSGLNGEDLTNRRAICEPSNIANCADAQEGYPVPTCNRCNKGYFKSASSECQLVLESIDKCETYFKDGVCAQCEPNHLLNHSKDACEFDLTFLGDNCQEGKFFSEPHCARCKSGFYFNSSGDCKGCTMEGCAVCGATDSASCKLCKNGYYMNTTKNCIKSGTKKLAKTVDGEECPEGQGQANISETADTGLDSKDNILGMSVNEGANKESMSKSAIGLAMLALLGLFSL